MPTYAVVLAGGKGVRLSAKVPKQFIDLGGRPIIDYSLGSFSRSPFIDEIIVVVTPEHHGKVTRLVKGYSKVTAVIVGGETRFASTAAALAHLTGASGHVLVHDAARPYLPQATIESCVEALQTHDAVATVVESPDTIVALDVSRTQIEATLERDGLRRLQTPQAFRLTVLVQAFERALRDTGISFTDDFTLVQQCVPEASSTFVVGSVGTFKITVPEDLIIAAALLENFSD